MTVIEEFKSAISAVKDYIQQYEDGLTTAYETRCAIIDKLNEPDTQELIKDHELSLTTEGEDPDEI